MRKIKIAAGLAHVDYGNIADLVKQVTAAGADPAQTGTGCYTVFLR